MKLQQKHTGYAKVVKMHRYCNFSICALKLNPYK